MLNRCRYDCGYDCRLRRPSRLGGDLQVPQPIAADDREASASLGVINALDKPLSTPFAEIFFGKVPDHPTDSSHPASDPLVSGITDAAHSTRPSSPDTAVRCRDDIPAAQAAGDVPGDNRWFPSALAAGGMNRSAAISRNAGTTPASINAVTARRSMACSPENSVPASMAALGDGAGMNESCSRSSGGALNRTVTTQSAHAMSRIEHRSQSIFTRTPPQRHRCGACQHCTKEVRRTHRQF